MNQLNSSLRPVPKGMDALSKRRDELSKAIPKSREWGVCEVDELLA